MATRIDLKAECDQLSEQVVVGREAFHRMREQLTTQRDTALADLAAAMTVVEAACAWQAAWEAQWSAPDPDEHSDADVIATGTAMRAAIKSFRSRTKEQP